MPTCKSGATMVSGDWAVDTSVAVAAVDGAHLRHEVCREMVRKRQPALSGHASFELFAVLTRMPGELAIDPGDAAALIAKAFPRRIWLSDSQSQNLWDKLAPLGILGGAVYDALVGEASRVNGCTLLTNDRRASKTYDLIGVSYEFVA